MPPIDSTGLDTVLKELQQQTAREMKVSGPQPMLTDAGPLFPFLPWDKKTLTNRPLGLASGEGVPWYSMPEGEAKSIIEQQKQREQEMSEGRTVGAMPYVAGRFLSETEKDIVNAVKTPVQAAHSMIDPNVKPGAVENIPLIPGMPSLTMMRGLTMSLPRKMRENASQEFYKYRDALDPMKIGFFTPVAENIKQDNTRRAYYDSFLKGMATELGENGIDLVHLFATMRLLGGLKAPAEAKFFQGTSKMGMLKKYITSPEAIGQLSRISTYGFFTSEGDLTDKAKAASTMLAYNITPYISNSTGLMGLKATTVDALLNIAISSPVYADALKEGITPDALRMILPTLMTDIGFSLTTRGWPETRIRAAVEKYAYDMEKTWKAIGLPERNKEEFKAYIESLRKASLDDVVKTANEQKAAYLKAQENIEQTPEAKIKEKDLSHIVDDNGNVIFGKGNEAEVTIEKASESAKLEPGKKEKKAQQEVVEKQKQTKKRKFVHSPISGQRVPIDEMPPEIRKLLEEVEEGTPEYNQIAAAGIIATANNKYKKGTVRKKADRVEISDPMDADIMIDALAKKGKEKVQAVKKAETVIREKKKAKLAQAKEAVEEKQKELITSEEKLELPFDAKTKTKGALEHGKKIRGNQVEIDKLQLLRDKILEKNKALKGQKGKEQEGYDNSVKAQLAREAIEEATRELKPEEKKEAVESRLKTKRDAAVAKANIATINLKLHDKEPKLATDVYSRIQKLNEQLFKNEITREEFMDKLEIITEELMPASRVKAMKKAEPIIMKYLSTSEGKILQGIKPLEIVDGKIVGEETPEQVALLKKMVNEINRKLADKNAINIEQLKTFIDVTLAKKGMPSTTKKLVDELNVIAKKSKKLKSKTMSENKKRDLYSGMIEQWLGLVEQEMRRPKTGRIRKSGPSLMESKGTFYLPSIRGGSKKYPVFANYQDALDFAKNNELGIGLIRSVSVEALKDLLERRVAVQFSDGDHWGGVTVDPDATITFVKGLPKDAVKEYMFVDGAEITPYTAKNLIEAVESGLTVRQLSCEADMYSDMYKDSGVVDSSLRDLKTTSTRLATMGGRGEALKIFQTIELGISVSSAVRLLNASKMGEDATVGKLLKEIAFSGESRSAEEELFRKNWTPQAQLNYMYRNHKGFFKSGVTPDTKIDKNIFAFYDNLKMNTAKSVKDEVFHKVIQLSKTKKGLVNKKFSGMDAETKKILSDAKEKAEAIAEMNEVWNKVVEEVGPDTPINPVVKPIFEHLLGVAAKDFGLERNEIGWDNIKLWVADAATKVRNGVALLKEATEADFAKAVSKGKSKKKISAVAEVGKNKRIVYKGGEYILEGFKDDVRILDQRNFFDQQLDNIYKFIIGLDNIVEPVFKGEPVDKETLRIFREAQQSNTYWFDRNDSGEVGPQDSMNDALGITYGKIDGKPIYGYRDNSTLMMSFGFPDVFSFFKRLNQNKQEGETGFKGTRVQQDIQLSRITNDPLPAVRDVTFSRVRFARADSDVIKMQAERATENIASKFLEANFKDKSISPEVYEAMEEFWIRNPANPTAITETGYGKMSGMKVFNSLSDKQKVFVCNYKALISSMGMKMANLGIISRESLDNEKTYVGYSPRAYMDRNGKFLGWTGKVTSDMPKRKHPVPRNEAIKEWHGDAVYNNDVKFVIQKYLLDYAARAEARSLYQAYTLKLDGSDTLRVSEDGNPVVVSTGNFGRVYVGADADHPTDMEVFKNPKLWKKQYVKLSNPTALGLIADNPGDVKSSIRMFDHFHGKDKREVWVHKAVAPDIIRDLKEIYNIGNAKLTGSLPVWSKGRMLTKMATFWNMIWPSWNMFNTSVFATTSYPFKNVPIVRRFSWVLGLPIGITKGGWRGVKSFVTGLAEASPVGLGGLTGIVAGGIIGGPISLAPAIGAVSGASLMRLVQAMRGFNGKDVHVGDVLPFMRKWKTPYHTELAMARTGFSMNTGRDFVQNMTDGFFESYAENVKKGKFDQLTGAIDSLFYNKFGLTRALWTAVKTAAAQSWETQNAFFKSMGIPEKDAQRLSSYALSLAFGLPEQGLQFSRMWGNILRQFMVARNSQSAVVKQATGMFMGAYGYGKGLGKAGRLLRGIDSTSSQPVKTEEGILVGKRSKQLFTSGHWGFTEKEANALSTFFYKQQVAQAFTAVMTAGILTYLLAGYFAWEREDTDKIFDIGTGDVDKDGNEIMITPMIFKDTRDLQALLSIPFDMFGNERRVPRYILNKSDFLLQSFVESAFNTDFRSMQPLTPKGASKIRRASDALYNIFEGAGSSFTENKYNRKLEDWEKKLGLLGIRTRRGMGGTGYNERGELKQNVYINRARQQDIQQYERGELREKLLDAWYSGDKQALLRIGRQYFRSYGEMVNFIRGRENPLVGQYRRLPRELKQRIMSGQL